MARKAILMVVVLGMILAASIFPTQAQQQSIDTIITDQTSALDSHTQSTTDVALSFKYLNIGKTLAADGSAAIYINNVLKNDGSTALDSHTWCFGFTGSEYTNIFAEDTNRFLEYRTYTDFWTGYFCVETTFATSISNGQEYQYGLGIDISEFADIDSSGTINAGWKVTSANKAQQYVDEVWWPNNRTAVSVSPTPNALGWDYARWERTFDQAPWELTITVTIEPGTNMDVTPLSQGIYPYTNLDVPWENDDYSNVPGSKIWRWGCMLTSATMAVNYYAQLHGLRAINPGELNAALKNIPGGYSMRFVNLAAISQAAQNIYGIDHPIIHYGEGILKEDVDDHLKSGHLIILGVTLCLPSGRCSEHFVLATGITYVGGTKTYVINDPYEDSYTTTLLKQYGGEFTTAQILEPVNYNQKPSRVLMFVHSPVELIITDQYGQKTGYDPITGTTYDEIPGSSYYTQTLTAIDTGETVSVKVFEHQTALPAGYQVDIIGTGVGTYTMDYVAFSALLGPRVEQFSGDTTTGEIDTVYLSYDPNLGNPWEVFLPLIRK